MLKLSFWGGNEHDSFILNFSIFLTDRGSIHFDSHDVSKSDSSSSLNILDPDDVESATTGVQADPDKLSTIVSTVRRELGMSLLGIDVVVENNTGRHAVIDINAYPGKIACLI